MEKPVEEKNQERTNLLQAIFEETTDIIFIKDLNGRYLLVNKVGARYFGKTPAEVIGKDNSILYFPPGTAKRIGEFDRKVIRTGETQTYEVKLYIDGALRTFLSTKCPYRDHLGKIIGVIAISRDITDRKLAEETLRAEHAYRKPIEEAMLAGVGAADLTGKLIYVNPAFCKIVGWNEQELLGQTPPYPFWSSENIKDIKEIFKNQLSSDHPFEIEVRFQRKNGERFPVLIKTAPLTDGHGNKIGIVATIGDITHQKLSEIKLQESYNLLESIIEGTTDAIYLRDLEGRYLMINSSGARLFGKSPEEIIGKHLSELFSPEFVQKTEEVDRMTLKSGKIETLENKITINGEDRIFLTTRGPIRDHENEISGFFGISRDITERKLAEEKLRAEYAFRKAIEDSMTTGIIAADVNGRLIYVNPAFCKMVEWPEEELVGSTPPFVYWPQEEWENIKQGFQKRMDKNRRPDEHLFCRRNGERFPVSVMGSRLTDGNGNLIGNITLVNDITEKRKIEDELLKVHKLESLGVLAGGIAHDFNNILTAILGNISLGKSVLKPHDWLYSRMTDAEKACLRATDLSRQLLTFAKGGAPVKKTVDMKDILEHSVQFALRGSNVRAEFSFQQDLNPVAVDEAQIGQVIQNIAINAMQAMPSGGTVKVNARNFAVGDEKIDGISLRKGRYVEISIQDTGFGIPEEMLPKIFDPYFTTKIQGSGLGLAISYSIVQRHEGYITVKSTLAVGTAFIFYLPASTLDISPSNEAAEVLIKGTGKILVVDDEVDVLQVVGEMLRVLGYEFELATSGKEALRKYKQAQKISHPFLTVITDLTMPGEMGGAELLQELKAIDSHVKVIVSSGYSNEPVISDPKAYGFADSMVKPYRLFDLGETLLKVIQSEK